MTDVLSNSYSRSRHFGELLVLSMATALMCIFMGLPSDDMYEFLSSNGLTTLDRYNYAGLAGANAGFWLTPAIIAYGICSYRKLTFLDWPLWANIFVGLGFSSMWGGVLHFVKMFVNYYDACCVGWM